MTSTADGLRLAGLDLFFVELLRQIPVSAEPGDSAAARERLYPSISRDPEMTEEWRTYVHPELKSLFQSAAETVRGDLEGFEQRDEASDDWTFEIPARHFEAWLNVLNQARLALSARYEFTDREMSQDGPRGLETVRELSMFQVHFYGFLQECILRNFEM